ncbi:hypothetical protein ACWD8L_40175 [Streptomyces sp. NPDC005133]
MPQADRRQVGDDLLVAAPPSVCEAAGWHGQRCEFALRAGEDAQREEIGAARIGGEAG